MTPRGYYDCIDEHEDDEEPVYGICASCGKQAKAVRRDMGIGPYEYWGARGTHHDWQIVSECCEAEVMEPDVESEDDDDS